MIDLFDRDKRHAIRFPCPTGKHAIEIDGEPRAVIAIPRQCPTCGIGLPEAYRAKVREIVNTTRFQAQTLEQSRADIEIISA